MSWIELKLNVPHSILDDISGYLFASGCEGINVTDEGVIIYFTKRKWTEEIKISLLEFIQHSYPEFTLHDIKTVSVAEQDWNENWKAYFKPIHITTRIVVKPPWEEYYAQTGEIVITINPQMAFGTGHHESTKLAIMALEKFLKPKMSVLDVGTGSGILAIIADKLNAENIVAIDNDPVAIKNAVENFESNKSSTNIQYYIAQPEQMRKSEYDVILANINRNVILQNVTLFNQFLIKDGIIILSGLLRNDEPMVLKTFRENGFVLLDKNTDKDWLSMVLKLARKEETDETGGN